MTAFQPENLDICIAGQRMIKTDRLPVDQYRIYLRVWNATRFDDILDRRLFG
jgi:hypothetical protein